MVFLFKMEDLSEFEFKSTLGTRIEKDKVSLTLESKIENSINAEERAKAEAESKDCQDALPRWLKHEVLKTIAAFSNSLSGGILVIGANDEEHLVGIERDYSSFATKQNWDGWLLALKDIDKQNLGVTVAAALTVNPHTIYEKNFSSNKSPIFTRPHIF